MQPVWKVLAPVDLNEHTGVAVERAIDFTNAVSGELVLLHVRDRVICREARRAWPSEAVGGVEAERSIHRVVLPGEPAPTIRRYADFIDADVVLMSPRGRGDWARFWRASVTTEVLDAIPRPVLVANTAAADARLRCRTILCVLNLDGTDDPVIECANRLAVRSGAEITILHVLPEISASLLAWGVPQSDRPLSRAVAMDRIRDLSWRLPAASRTSVTTGALQKSIVATARQTRPDLVIFGRTRPGVWAPACPDPRALARRVGCPILTVPVSAAPPAERRLRQYQRPQRGNVSCDI